MRKLTNDIIDLYNGLIETRDRAGQRLDETHRMAMRNGIEIALDQIAIMFLEGQTDHRPIPDRIEKQTTEK